jgi:hypothetical protein
MQSVANPGYGKLIGDFYWLFLGATLYSFTLSDKRCAGARRFIGGRLGRKQSSLDRATPPTARPVSTQALAGFRCRASH